MAGFRKSIAQTSVDTGLPGRPSSGVFPSLPKIRGLPGRIAIFQKSSSNSSRSKRFLNQIVFADGSAAERDDEVCTLCIVRDARHGFLRVGQDAKVDHVSAPTLDHGRQRVARRRDNAAGLARRAGQRKLVASCSDSHLRPPADADMRNVAGCDQRKIARRQPMTARRQRFTGLEIESGDTNVASRGRRDAERNEVILGRRIFLDDNGVRTVRHDTAGENAHSLTGADASSERMTRWC